MSFYGSVYYQLVDAFNRIVFNNKGPKKTTFPTTALDEETVENAQGRTSKIKINTGNRWLAISKDNESDYSFWHTAPNAEAKTIISAAELVDENGKSITTSTLKSKIKGSTIKYDEAGHVVGAEKNITFELHPKPATADNKTFTPFDKSSSGTGAIELAPGDYIKIVSVKYDDLGHLTTTQEKVYQLPMSETEKNIEEIQKAIEDLQAKDISLSSTDQDFEQRITYAESAIDVQNSHLGSYNTLFPEKGELGGGFFDAFGSVEQVRTKVFGDSASTKTVSDALSEIYDKADGVSASQAAINRSLMSDIEKIKNHLGIE